MQFALKRAAAACSRRRGLTPTRSGPRVRTRPHARCTSAWPARSRPPRGVALPETPRPARPHRLAAAMLGRGASGVIRRFADGGHAETLPTSEPVRRAAGPILTRPLEGGAGGITVNSLERTMRARSCSCPMPTHRSALGSAPGK